MIPSSLELVGILYSLCCRIRSLPLIMHDLNTSRYFFHDSARCGTSGNLTWKEVMHDFVFRGGSPL